VTVAAFLVFLALVALFIAAYVALLGERERAQFLIWRAEGNLARLKELHERMDRVERAVDDLKKWRALERQGGPYRSCASDDGGS
jgi:hypothetical protein